MKKEIQKTIEASGLIFGEFEEGTEFDGVPTFYGGWKTIGEDPEVYGNTLEEVRAKLREKGLTPIEGKYRVTTRNSVFFIELWQDGNKTTWVRGHEKRGSCAPTYWELMEGLDAIARETGMDVFFENRKDQRWHPVNGWLTGGSAFYEDQARWRVIDREGTSGCRDFYVTKEVLGSRFGEETRIAAVHISMYGKLNQGYCAPVPFLEFISSQLLPMATVEEAEKMKAGISVERLPDEDTREWRSDFLI